MLLHVDQDNLQKFLVAFKRRTELNIDVGGVVESTADVVVVLTNKLPAAVAEVVLKSLFLVKLDRKDSPVDDARTGIVLDQS